MGKIYTKRMSQETRVCPVQGLQHPESGKEITFPVADGRARYIVVSLKPVVMIHDDTGDAWNYDYVHRLTAADIRTKIKQQNDLNKLINKKRKP
jgi:hypothetical protein